MTVDSLTITGADVTTQMAVPLQAYSPLDKFVDPFATFVTDVLTLNPVLLQLLVFGLLIGGVYALTALGLTMIFGVMDIINFAHGAFLVMGMYTTFVLTSTFGINAFLTLPAALVFLFVAGWIIERLVIEPIIDAPEQNQLIVTIGLWYILGSTIEIIFSPDPQRIDLRLGSLALRDVFIPYGQLLGLFVAGIAMAVIWGFLQYTDRGRSIRGTADNRTGAQYVGIDITRMNALTFAFGAALAGIAGAAVALFRQFDPFTGTTFLVNAFIIVVLGGLGSFPGAFVAGLIIGLAQVFGSYYLPGTTYQIGIFGIFIAILLVKPEGLFGGKKT
jgi:branched-chain amino acid transport system permease protein